MIKSFICGVAGTSLLDEEKEFLAREQPYGVILFARNVESPAQVRALTAEIKALLTHPYAEILVDQEGGRVQRLKPPHWRKYPTAATLAASKECIRNVYINGRMIAEELRNVGITMDCAPVADVLTPEGHKIIGDRAFGDNVEQVSVLARAQSEALLDGGILSILKHIPGHGRATMDSHETLPIVSAPLSELERVDFAVFKQLNDLPLAMTAHILYTALDDKRCATFSPVVMEYIRTEIGFNGLIMSDDLSMKALGGSFAERTERSLAAGCDLVLHGNGALVGEPVRDLMKELKEIAAVATPMSEESLKRAKAAADQRRAPKPAEEQALLTEWQGLVAAA